MRFKEISRDEWECRKGKYIFRIYRFGLYGKYQCIVLEEINGVIFRTAESPDLLTWTGARIWAWREERKLREE